MSRADGRRQKVADEIRKLSEAIASLANRIRWACRDARDDRSERAHIRAGSVGEMLFTLAQDVASGRVELDGPDSPRPLFDRPSEVRASFEPEPEPARTLAPPAPDPDDFRAQPGDEYFRCNRCDMPRRREVAVCPACGCPEFRLVIADADGRLVKDLEALARLKAPPKKRAPKVREESTPVESARREEPDPLDSPRMDEPPAHSYEVSLPDDGSGNSSFLGICHAASLKDAIRDAPAQFKDDLTGDFPLAVEPSSAHVDGKYGRVAECLTCGRRWLASGGLACPSCVHAPAPAMPERPARKPRKRKEAIH